MIFRDPQWLLLLPLLLPWLLIWRRNRRRAPALPVPDWAQVSAVTDGWRVLLARHLPWLRLLLLVLVILAMARPQMEQGETRVVREGIDLVIALDLSTSMLAEDPAEPLPRKNRLGIAKEVLAGFIQSRPGDRIGLVAFAARAYPGAPLTLDHTWLESALTRLEIGAIEDGTAIGDGMLAALNRLQGPSPGHGERSRAVILITDGRYNAGTVSPQVAASAARTLGIRIHTVGIGARGMAVIPVDSPLGGTVYRQVVADLDEPLLREIAAISGGAYHRADDRQALRSVFEAIDRLEKQPVEETIHFSHEDLFPPLLLTALALLLAELALRATLLRMMP